VEEEYALEVIDPRMSHLPQQRGKPATEGSSRAADGEVEVAGEQLGERVGIRLRMMERRVRGGMAGEARDAEREGEAGGRGASESSKQVELSRANKRSLSKDDSKRKSVTRGPSSG
jgi:hypothetical protein